MTEQDWLVCADPQRMLDDVTKHADPRPGVSLRLRASDRKLRLFACAVARQCWHLLTDERSRRAVEVAERFADGEATDREMFLALGEAHMARRDAGYEPQGTSSPAHLAHVVMAGDTRSIVAVYCRADTHALVPPALQAALLREIVGNPFRSVALPPCSRCDGDGKAHGSDRPFEWTPEVGYPGPCPVCEGRRSPWITPTVLSIATAAYQERGGRECGRCGGKGGGTSWPSGFWEDCPDCAGTGVVEDGTLDPERLAVLADALTDAGCDSEPLLRHLRGWAQVPDKWHTDGWVWARTESPHVRGCWAIDLLLGKS